MPELQILNGALQWKTVRVVGPRFLIGRKDQCQLVLQDGWASREHTLIFEPKPGEFVVKDLGSENGTYLNGERVAEGRLKNGDVLRVGRTEMKFVVHAIADERTPVRLAAPGAAGGRTESNALLRTWAEGSGADVAGDSTPTRAENDKDKGGTDWRERLRRMEKRLLELEQANARFAAENAVLKKALDQAGLWDRGAHRTKAAPSAPAAGPAAAAPLRRPGAVAATWYPCGAAGRVIAAEALRRGAGPVAPEGAPPGALASATADADVVFLCATWGEIVPAVFEAALAAVEAAAPGRVGLFLWSPPGPPPTAERAAFEAAFGVVRRAADAGRFRAVVVAPGLDAAAAAAAFLATLRAPLLPTCGGASSFGGSADDVRATLFAPGYAVPSRVPFEAASEAAAAEAARRALDAARTVRLSPASRAREAAAWVLIASGPRADDRLSAVAPEAALDGAAGLLPQARIRRGVRLDDEGNAAVALVGGLPFPDRAFGEAR